MELDNLSSDSFQWDGAEIIGELVQTTSTFINTTTSGGNQNNMLLDIDKSNWDAEELAAYQALRSKRKKCIVSGCTSRSLPIARSYHQLPVRNLEVWQKWVEGIRWSKNEPDWLPSTDQPLVCSRHFLETDFVSYQGSSRSRLNHNAVPVLYMDPPDGSQMDARFAEERELPQVVAFTKFKAAHAQRNNHNNKVNAQSRVNDLLPPLNSYKLYVKDPTEHQEEVEVTPEFNFEEPLEYDGELSEEYDYDQQDIDNYYTENGMVASEEQTFEEDQEEYDDEEFSSTRSTLLYGATEMTPLEEDEEEVESQSLSSSKMYVQQQQQPKMILKTEQSSTSTSSKTQQQANKMPIFSNNTFKETATEKKKFPSAYIQQQSSSRNSFLNNGSNTLKTYSSATRKTIVKTEKTGAAGTGRDTPTRIIMKIPNRSMIDGGNTGGGSSLRSNGIGTSPTKHKIGMSKCRLIVEQIEEELETQLKTIKMRVAQQMQVPFQVVHGVWQIKEKIKPKNNNKLMNS